MPRSRQIGERYSQTLPLTYITTVWGCNLMCNVIGMIPLETDAKCNTVSTIDALSFVLATVETFSYTTVFVMYFYEPLGCQKNCNRTTFKLKIQI